MKVLRLLPLFLVLAFSLALMPGCGKEPKGTGQTKQQNAEPPSPPNPDSPVSSGMDRI